MAICFRLRCWLLIASFLSLPVLSSAADFYVSTAGDDHQPGTHAAPFRTLAAAREAAGKIAGHEDVTIHVADGTHYLPETLVITASDSGSERHPVVYQADNEGKAVLSGGLRLDLKWEPQPGGIFKATTPSDLVIDQLFIDGARQRMARYPNFDATKSTEAYQGFSADAFSKERAAKWADPAGGYIHAMHRARWGGYHYRITGKNPDGTIAYEGGWQNNRQMGMHASFRMVENIFEELDASGEWFHNAKTHTLFFKPEPSMDLAKAVVEVVRLRHLVEFRGSAEQPVRCITFKGFTFRHAARTFMDTKEPLLRSDWAIYRGGAVLLTGTEHVSILDSEFDQVGGNAVFVNNYNRHALIKGCHIHDAGASGVCFVGDPNAVRNPLFEYGQKQDLTKIDRTPGPKTSNYPAESIVEDCLIHGIGRVERQPAGVEISMSQQITVRDTSIYDCARAGINISEGTWGGHLIERCDVFDTVLETGDHGSFNSWGRDRYWVSNHRAASQPEVEKDPKLPFLDAMMPNVIRDSRWRCDHGWDIDLDDGSSNYLIYNNLLLAGGLKFREGYGRKATNNIIINNGFHVHVWFDNSASEFRHNIVTNAHAPIGKSADWTKLIDGNFFLSESARRKYLADGCDAKSVNGDPMFVDPAAGDFRVKDGSLALAFGFKNFPMDQFGVKKASLRKIAKTPVISVPLAPLAPLAAPPSASSPHLFWLGASLHSLEGEEYSAFGASSEDMGVQLVKVPKDSPASMSGLKDNDLIQAINGNKVSNTQQLFGALAKAGAEPMKLRLIRTQKPLELAIKEIPSIHIETANSPEGFKTLILKKGLEMQISSNVPTTNDPLQNLTDGQLAASYGPVFPNGVKNGCYKLDLGNSQVVHRITAWSNNQGGTRGAQKLTYYASNSQKDPGWDVRDPAQFAPLGSIITNETQKAPFTASSLKAANGKTLGSYRWLVIETSPVTNQSENTAWQEFAIE